MDHRLPTLFGEVADLTPAERAAYFQSHDTPRDLASEIESLLRFDQADPGIFGGILAANMEHLDPVRPGDACGPYQLTRLLGQGGMGSVYLAERTDGEVNLRVAIKFVRGPETLAFHQRFFRERQILAGLSHPGIARLLDAGHTAAGQPYLVMEYVDGSPIDQFAAPLRLRDKLTLFLKVCDAVSYLHHNLVIHRDLKPSNILVEPHGAPRLLDFGIAAMLDEIAAPGATKERLLTPDYASPEQIKGSAKTTATDVYSLGVVLYQLLTTHSPYPLDRDSSTEELVLTASPIPARRLNPAVPRDLEFVLAKALRKDPGERYSNVDAMAADLRAVLESRPVRARSGNALYVARKFFRRHWLTTSATAAAILGLAAGLYIADRQRSIAQNRFAQIRQLSQKMLELDETVRGLPGSTKTREQIVAVTTRYLDSLGREVTNDPDLTLEVANGRLLTAEIQGVATNSSLGEFAEAEHTLQTAAGLVDHVLARRPHSSAALLLGAQVAADRMIVADSLHNWDAESAHAERAAQLLEPLLKSGSATQPQLQEAARAASNVGQARMNMHEYAKATPDIRRGLDLMRAAGSSAAEIAQATSLLANAQRQAGDLPGALESANQARDTGDALHFANETARVRVLYSIYWRQGLVLGDANSVSWGRTADALSPFQKAFDLVYQASLRDPLDASTRDRVGTAGVSLADALVSTDAAAALEIYNRTLTQLRQGSEQSARLRESKTLSHSSYALRALKRFPEAKARIDAAFALLRALPDYQEHIGLIGGEWDDATRAQADLSLELHHADAAHAELLDCYQRLLERKPNPQTDLVHATALSRLYLAIEAVDAPLKLADEMARFEDLRLALWRGWRAKLPNNWYVQQRLDEKPAMVSGSSLVNSLSLIR